MCVCVCMCVNYVFCGMLFFVFDAFFLLKSIIYVYLLCNNNLEDIVFYECLSGQSDAFLSPETARGCLKI